MFEKEYEKSIEAAKEGGAVIAGYFSGGYSISEKGKDQPVTNADKEANDIIRKILLKSFPDDGWLSEETRDNRERLKKNRVWIVDPLDGTKEFIGKIKEFAVSIALSVAGRPVVGVVYNPLTSELFTARVGTGTFLNLAPVRVSNAKNLEEASILASRSELKRNEWDRFEGKFVIRPSGGMAWKMVLTASGTADGSFSLQPKNEWDFCAGTLLVLEAGGLVSTLEGREFSFNNENPRVPGLVYANPVIHKKLLELLKSQ